MNEIYDFVNFPTTENFVPNAKSFSVTELDRLPLAMAYVPMQRLNGMYDAAQALDNGTLFPELDKPFYGKKCK